MRQIALILLIYLKLTGLAQAADGAAVTGMVKLTKLVAPPPMKARYDLKPGQVIAAAEAACAVVYLEVPAAELPSPPPVVQMTQRDLQFAPGLLAIRRGTRVEFPNQDSLYHNVFSYSKAKRFDLGRYLKDENPPALIFEQVGVVRLYCEIHEHMRGTIVVVDTPYFQKTDTNGVFQLSSLPVGKFKLKAWVDEKHIYERAVELKDGVTAKVDFPVE